MEDGNLDDKTWNHAFIQRARAVLTNEEWDSLTYVGQRTGDTRESAVDEARRALLYYATVGLLLVKPRVVGRSDEARGLARSTLRGRRAAVRLPVQSFDRELYGQTLRFVVVHSSHLEERQRETLLRQMSKEQER